MGRTIRLPEGVLLNDCRFQRIGDDIMLVSNAQGKLILRHFYQVEKAPALRDANGDLLSGDLARLLAGLSDHAVDMLMRRGFRNSAG